MAWAGDQNGTADALGLVDAPGDQTLGGGGEGEISDGAGRDQGASWGSGMV